LADLGLDDGPVVRHRLDSNGRFNLLKSGVTFSDAVVTVSASHAEELVTEIGGFGLHGDFRALGSRLSGVRNGIDQSVWNPATDPHIASNFSRDDLAGKATCKAALQADHALPRRADAPVFVMSTRLVTQKGLDLILRSASVRAADAQFVFLGRGERRLHEALAALARERPANVAVQFEFTDVREHRAVSGADFLLMPSLYEPCGLTQMRAQRYGAPVVARDVGGLRDTVDDGETGFVFADYDEHALDAALARALAVYGDGETYRAMQRRAMTRNFGWAHPAGQYARVYDAALQAVAVR
jgi:starch synthase